MSDLGKQLEGIAIIGMAGRFPKAKNVDGFWQNLCAGVEAVSFFDDAELDAAEQELAQNNPNYVSARAILEDADLFDAAFFGVNPKEAEIMDPQHRVFLECAWEALESAGYDPQKYGGAIGVFAGASMNTYLTHNLLSHPDLITLVGDYQVMLGNDKDFLTTRVSYKLNLRGPSLNIQTACSTSLVAVCVACQHLLNYACDMALAGAVSITFPQKRGYLFQEGGIGSPDGRCRTFDADAAGTVPGQGVGIVVLKRLEEALTDGDQIYAVIKGSAVNNDGSLKIGYTAPSVQGQAEVIALAQAMAGVEPESIGYVEAHGTGTPLGDPIEIEGLTRAFRAGTQANNFCAIGSVKSNIGHLDTAAGVAGLIKTALALRHKLLPPSLHYQAPNPKIDLANSPFHVNTKLSGWKSRRTPRRASVSSFGIGGTNAHVVLEEAPALELSEKSRPMELLLLSARTETALDKTTANLAEHLKKDPQLNLADVAYTLSAGRREFNHRRMLVCRDADDAVSALAERDVKRVFTRIAEHEDAPVVFMFSGQGAQQPNMAFEIFNKEPAFREEVDRCADILKLHLGLDLRTLLYPDAAKIEEAKQQLTQTYITQPALFVIEYALAKLWMSWGVRPAAMIGHSIGEYVAACLADVFSLAEALALVAARGRMMQQLPGGAMLALRLPENEAQSLLNDELSLSAVNGASSCVVSGPTGAVSELEDRLTGRGIASRRLQTSHAFHSAMVEPVLQPFTERVRTVNLKPPKTAYVSNVTGTWITAAQATDPGYWAKHLRQTVRFANGLGEILQKPEHILLEVGPGQTLSTLAKQHPAKNAKTLVASSLPHAQEQRSETECLLHALGQLWLGGARINWRGFYAHERRLRVPLPTYPFERERHFVEPARPDSRRQPSARILPASPVEKKVEDEALDVKPHADAAPSSARQDRIVSTLKTLLGELSGRNLTDVGNATTFVEMGFDSLFLTQASVALEKRFGVKVAFRQLLGELATLDTLATYIEPTLLRHDAARHSTAKDVERRDSSHVNQVPEAAGHTGEPDRVAIAPLTESQRELWYASQLGDDASCAFNESCVLHLRGPLKMPALRDAVQKLVNQHEALRSTLSPSGVYQRILSSLAVDVPLLDWSGAEAGRRETQMDTLLTYEAKRPFDLINGPLLRAVIAKLDREHHALVLTVHHIICDGRSLDILLYALGELYSAECRGLPNGIPAPLQFPQYAREQASAEQAAKRTAAEPFWLDQFSGELPVLELPTDRPPPSGMSFAGARQGLGLNLSLCQSLKRVGAERDCTFFTTLLAAYCVFLHRLTGQETFAVGVPVAARAVEGSETLVGHCVNFLPLRVHLGSDWTFGECLKRIKQNFLDAYEHQDFAFGSLIQKLNLPRHTGRVPLTAVTFNVDRIRERLKFHRLEADVMPNPRSCSHFDLSFNLAETDRELRLDCRYRTMLFNPETIQRWLGHFQTLLEAIVADPEQRISESALLTPNQRQQILVEWNNTKADYSREKCIHQLFEEQAERTPEAVAVIFKDRQLTYRELNASANRLAYHLQRAGVGPEVTAGICMERSLEMVTGVLAILKAGGAYVPLDPAHPQDRLQLMLENARVPVLLTQQAIRGNPGFKISNLKLVCADAGVGSAGHKARSEENPFIGVAPNNLAYVIHTSGSTGVPKGVAIEHRSAVNLIHWAQEVFTREELAGVLFSTSICFDLSVFELFVTLSSGGKIIVAPSALELPNLPAKHEVTLINTVPSAASELSRLKAIPPSVRVVNLAGEPLQTALVDRLYALGTVKKVYDLYGPSETTTYSTFALRQVGAPATIGRPIANTQVCVLDAHRQPVPVGVIGEIYIGGDGLARGYLKRPDLTAERFIPNPFSREPGARLYQSGDRARWLSDGNIEFLGRVDHQVKIRGYRIELGEIESVLGRHPAVRECVAMAREDTPGERRLVSFVVIDSDKASLTPNDLRAFMQLKLPDYMVPSAFVFLDKLPLTPSGKVNRRALPASDPAQPAPERTGTAPGTPTEEAVAEIWRNVLGLTQVGVHDNFFELGGHSLLVTRVMSRVREAFRVELPMRQFFETPTIAALALAIEGMLIEEIKELSDEEARRLADSTS